jgi:hypothetical protein
MKPASQTDDSFGSFASSPLSALYQGNRRWMRKRLPLTLGLIRRSPDQPTPSPRKGAGRGQVKQIHH